MQQENETNPTDQTEDREPNTERVGDHAKEAEAPADEKKEGSGD